MSKKNYAGKVAVVTGASSGIGKAVYKELLNLGFTVACVCRRNPFEDEENNEASNNGKPTKKASNNDTPTPKNQKYYECDLSEPEQTERVGKQIANDFDRIDLLINNAGLGVSGATELLPLNSVRYVFEVDYFAPLILTQQLLPKMSKGSKIVNISSACALFALPYRNVYCSAKAALNMLGYGLRMELEGSGINVVNVCPGDVKTEFTSNRIKHTDTNDRYGGGVIASQQKIDSREDKRMNAQSVGKKITKIALKKKRALYIIGAKYKFLYFCSKIFSANFMVKMTGKIFNK